MPPEIDIFDEINLALLILTVLTDVEPVAITWPFYGKLVQIREL